MSPAHVEGAVRLQRACFPPPFLDELLWKAEHLSRHLELFPAGQFVAFSEGQVVASASNTRISEEAWKAHESWDSTVGGPFLDNLDPAGTTLYGLDISVHPDWRGRGLARLLYQERFALVERLALARYGTACRLPGFANHPSDSPEEYAVAVANGQISDRTLTPLLRIGLRFLGVIQNYMVDEESGHAAALLEWTA